MEKREQWILVNLVNKTISSGIPGVPVLRPGKSIDLLFRGTKELVRQSSTIKFLLEKQWVKIEQWVDDELHRTVTAENIGDLSDTTISLDLDENQDGNLDLQGQSINMNNGTGQGGGNLQLDGGSLVFNNSVSFSSMGDLISANCGEFSMAGGVSVFGDCRVFGQMIAQLPQDEPHLLEVGTFTFYEKDGVLYMKAVGSNGVEIKLPLGSFGS